MVWCGAELEKPGDSTLAWEGITLASYNPA